MKQVANLPDVRRPGGFYSILLALLTFILLPTLHFSTIFFNEFETEHFTIFFTPQTEYAAEELRGVAERVYSKVSTLFGYELREKIRIYVVEDHDHVNAYADPIFDSIVIYPNIPSGALHMFPTDFDNWMESLLTHELTHIFIGNRVAPYFKPFSIFGKPIPKALQALFIPMYIHEGLAVYAETVLTEGGRLRYPYFLSLQETAHDGLGYAGGASTRYDSLGGLPYVQGSSFLWFLSEEYGETNMVETVKGFLDNPVLGLGRVIKGRTLSKWRNWVERRREERFKNTFSWRDDPEGWMPRSSPTDGIAYVDHNGIHLGSKCVQILGLIDYSLSESGELAIVRYALQGSHVWSFLVIGGSVIDRHVVDVAWKDSEHLWAIRQDGNGKRSVVEYTVKGDKAISQRVLLSPSDLEPLELTDGDPEYFVGRYRGRVDLFHYDPDRGTVFNLTNDDRIEENPSFSKDFNGVCYLTYGGSEGPKTSVWLLKGEGNGYAVSRVYSTRLAIADPIVKDGELVFSYVSGDGTRRLHRVPLGKISSGELREPKPLEPSSIRLEVPRSTKTALSIPTPRFWLPVILPEGGGTGFGIALGLVDDYNTTFAVPVITDSEVRCLFGYLKNPQILAWLAPKPWLNFKWKLDDPSSLDGDHLTVKLSYDNVRPELSVSRTIGVVRTRYLSAPRLEVGAGTSELSLDVFGTVGNAIVSFGITSREDEIFRIGVRTPLTLLDIHTRFGYAFLDWIDLVGKVSLGNDGSHRLRLAALVHGAVQYSLDFTLEIGLTFDGSNWDTFWQLDL